MKLLHRSNFSGTLEKKRVEEREREREREGGRERD